MILYRTIYATIAFLILLGISNCNQGISKKTIRKIEFDQTMLDKNGMLNSEVALDYEFCIPMDEAKVAEVKSIEPDVNIPRMAKGRIGCTKEEYLCIVSTKGPQWKEKLYTIASLPYVKRIIQTHYE